MATHASQTPPEGERTGSNAKQERTQEYKISKFDPSDPKWYFTRQDIEKNSPSIRDGMDLKREKYLRRSYCTFLETLGIGLKLPQITIATAIVFCHRFFMRQSHCKNDRYLIATVCMFLAGKVEETPRSLKEVIQIAYELQHKKDKDAAQRIKQKEVFEQQKELVLVGERLLLSTLEFDLNVYHPYKPLINTVKKFNLVQKPLPQMAWNFINDGLRTSLHIQFKPQQIAAGVIFLSAKFLKVKLPIEKDEDWMEHFEATPSQLEEVSSQLLDIYSQNKGGESRGSGPSSIADPSSIKTQHNKHLMGLSEQKTSSYSHKRTFSSRTDIISKAPPPHDAKSPSKNASSDFIHGDEDDKDTKKLKSTSNDEASTVVMEETSVSDVKEKVTVVSTEKVEEKIVVKESVLTEIKTEAQGTRVG